MKRKYLLFPILLLTLCIILSPASFKAEAAQKDLETLLDERQIDCWVEGEVFGDLILGSRGTIQFIYIDAKLSKAISAEQGLAPWVDDLNQYYGSPETKKKVLFIANLEANKPWTVEEQKISIGGYNLTKKGCHFFKLEESFRHGRRGYDMAVCLCGPAGVCKTRQRDHRRLRRRPHKMEGAKINAQV